MLRVKSSSEIHPANHATEKRPLGKITLSASSSPKMQELRARFEDIHATFLADQGTGFQHSNSR